MALNSNLRTVTDGLVLYLDAANTKSYVSGSTTWRDMSVLSDNSTLTNGPTFSNANGGSIVFDGVDDYSGFGAGRLTSGAVSMFFWINGNYQNYYLSVFERSPATGVGLSTVIPSNGWVYVGFLSTSGTNNFCINGNIYSGDIGASYAYDVPTIKPIFWMSSFSYFASNSNPCLSFQLQLSPGVSTGFTWADYLYKAIGITATGGNRRYFSGSIGLAQIYNRVLSASEVLQNYNATKGRYGL